MKKSKILIIDDLRPNREVLQGHVESWGHESQTSENGREALDLLLGYQPDLIICDVLMPEMDGVSFLEAFKKHKNSADIPVLMVSAVDEMDIVIKCLELGADDYLFKPFNSKILKARVESCLQKKHSIEQERIVSEKIRNYNITLEKEVKEGVKKLTKAQVATIFALSKLAESRDPETGEHLDRMREYTILLAKELSKNDKYKKQINEPFIENLYIASPLHDIGKVGIPDSILLKPGKLDKEEFEIIKTHTMIGAKTIKEVKKSYPDNLFLEMGELIAIGHHEKWNGKGYPRGLKGESIPLVCQILALGDVYDALTSSRCYKEAFSHQKSREIILEGRSEHFAPDVVDAFLECESKFIEIRETIKDKESE